MNLKCPACQNPLSTGFEIQDNEFIAFCGVGRCPSYKANDGARGRTELEAQQNLISKLNKEPDWLGED